jgi:hypothetical protein
LVDDNWDDFSFKTLSSAILFDEDGVRHDLGGIKILSRGLKNGRGKLPDFFDNRQLLLELTRRVVGAGSAYREAAEAGALDGVSAMEITNSERTLMRSLYDDRIVPRAGRGRYAYDEIHSSSDYCPYCSFGEVYELDHYLPKEGFCELNVLPINLLPICHPCNHIKRQIRPQGPRDGFLHPYFDKLPTDVRWLFAELAIQNGGPTLIYHVDLDHDQYGSLAGKLQYHFRELQLERRFRRQAASVLSELEAEVTQRTHELDAEQIAAHLLDRAHQFAEINLNSLETATYHAAAASHDYCQGQFRS